MKNTNNTPPEEKKRIEAQAAANKADPWVKVYLDGRKARMMRRSEYEAMHRA